MKKHWDTINRILDKGSICKALETHGKMRNDPLPTLDFLQLAIAINELIPKRYRKSKDEYPTSNTKEE